MSDLINPNDEYPLPIFQYAHSAVKILSFALSDLKVFSTVKDKEAKHFVNSYLMKNYHFSLMYTFTMEYCKLTEQHYKDSENHASLYKLSKTIHTINNTDFTKEDYQKVRNELKKIVNTDICKKIRIMRNQKFAHIDEPTKPFEMEHFSGDEFIEITRQFYSLQEILNFCVKPYESAYKTDINHPFYFLLSNSVEFNEQLDYSKAIDEIEKYAMYEKFYNDNN